MTVDTGSISNQNKLNFLVDALMNGGPSMSGGLSIESQIAATKLSAQNIERAGADGKVVKISALQELADCKTLLLAQQATLSGLATAVSQLATGNGIDPAALNAAVANAVKAAMSGLSGKVTFGTDGK